MGIVQTIGLYDKTTGEPLDSEVLFIGKNPRYLDRGYIKLFTAFLPDIVESDKLAGKSIRLLFYMLQNLDYDSLEVTIIPKYARESLKITKKTYHRWIKDLIEFGVIERIDAYRYRLKPYTFVKGSHEKATRLELQSQSSQKEV